MKKRLTSIVLIVAIICSFASFASATSMHSTTTTSYTTVTSGYDANNYYYFVQGDITWAGKAKNQWPSGATIYYAPFSQDSTQCGSFVGLSSTGASSGNIQYWSGKGYKANYRVGSYTSTSSADTTFSFFV